MSRSRCHCAVDEGHWSAYSANNLSWKKGTKEYLGCAQCKRKPSQCVSQYSAAATELLEKPRGREPLAGLAIPHRGLLHLRYLACTSDPGYDQSRTPKYITVAGLNTFDRYNISGRGSAAHRYRGFATSSICDIRWPLDPHLDLDTIA